LISTRRPLVRIRSTFVGIAAIAFCGVAQAQFQPPGRVVSFRTSDGRTVSGLLVEAADRPAAAVVLVPMLGRPRDDWQVAAQRLAEANITALAIDLPSTTAPGDRPALAGLRNAVTGAVAYLSGRPADIRPAAIGVGGASFGANLAVLAAAADPAIRSLALVSPALDYQGVRIDSAWAQYGARPALLMASVHDPYAARSVRVLARDTASVREVRWSTVTAHGTLLLSRDADLVRALVEWFQRTLE
jgi:acetyl esterase/lipase